MKTKILVTVALTTLLSSGLYANCNMKSENYMKKPGACPMKMEGQKNMDKKMFHKNHFKKEHNPTMRVLKELNLSPEQKLKIKEIRKEVFNKKRDGLEVAFTKDSFDKEKYIAVMKQKRDYMLESQASIMEKTFAILTPKQKEQFKVLIDLQKDKKDAKKELMKNRGMNFDKNCNGGR